MKLVALVLVPLLGGLLAWPLGRRRTEWARIAAVLALGVDLALALSLLGPAGPGGWLATFELPWIPSLGIGLRLGLDGLSLVLVLLTLLVGLLAVFASWSEIRERVGFFHFNLCWVLAGILGVFLALDLVLFYFLWELMLVPMVFLIALWGHERKTYAAIKFFL
ncbi:MAG: NADH-quinone oxidoreductase subunit M, partial [Acidobacteria bacterium]|nr:NADH-quinone oxidoreductase subunit M [Acidobacteriota bacterium]